MEDDHWGERQDAFDRKPVRTTVKSVAMAWVVVVVVIALVLVTGAILWFGRVETSDIKGRGDAEIIKNDARNRIRAQEGFEDKFAGIQAADKNIGITAAALEKQPSSIKLQTELSGQMMICNDLVGTYNAAARKFSQEEFKAADLPLKIDETDPTTDCKESK